MQPNLRTLIASIPALAGYVGPVQRLGGLTNQVYRLGDFCLRLPGAGTAEYINRANEANAADLAARAGIAPELIYVDAARGLMVTRFIAGVTTMDVNGFRARVGAPARAARALRQLHQSGARFVNSFNLFTMIEEYLAILSTKDVALPDGYHDVVAEAEAVRFALSVRPAIPVASHCDPLCENFLDTGSRMWLVDWEYSGMNDPMWDLGDLSVEGQFDAAQDHALLHAYFNGQIAPEQAGRMMIYKAMCDLLWTLWGLVQLANGNPADDFRAYSDSRFARCKALMAGPDFAEQLRAVAV